MYSGISKPNARISSPVRSAAVIAALVGAAHLFLCAVPLAASEQEPEENYQIVTHLSLEAALKKVFPAADEILETKVSLDAEQEKRVRARVGHPLTQTAYTIYIGKHKGSILGYAMVDDEIGKYHPITSIIGVSPQGKVLGVAVMVYRESRGGEVSRRRFLAQYEGKTSRDPIRTRRDIISISGATMSVNAISTQVRKVLAIVDEVFLKGGPSQ